MTRQDTETFLRCLENWLRSFGGCPLLLNLDNMKSVVLKADWFDPEINPKLADFCRHYGMHVVRCRPGKPEHKGKVERGVAYLRTNAPKGRRFRPGAVCLIGLPSSHNSLASSLKLPISRFQRVLSVRPLPNDPRGSCSSCRTRYEMPWRGRPDVNAALRGHELARTSLGLDFVPSKIDRP